MLALQFPVRYSLISKVSTGDAVFFTILLLYPAAEAALMAVVIWAVHSVVSAVRKVRRDGRPPDGLVFLKSTLFNMGQIYLSQWLAGQVLAFADRGGVWSLPTLAAIVLAAITFVSVNWLLVSVAVALITSERIATAFWGAVRATSARLAVLYGLAVLVAAGVRSTPWALAVLAFAALVVHLWLKRALQVSEGTLQVVQRMADQVDRRDPYTAGHSRRVADYAVRLAGSLGCSPAEIVSLRLAALVHDLGKIAVPNDILLKPGRLTPDERRIIESHPQAGYDLLGEYREYSGIRELILTHHERYDGMGYPYRVEGRLLPLLAQVMPVADTIDAMTTARPYRDALVMEVALGELRAGAGSQWNPLVVEAAQRVFGRPAPAPVSGEPALSGSRGGRLEGA